MDLELDEKGKAYVEAITEATQEALYDMAKQWDDQRHNSMIMLVESIRDDNRVYSDQIMTLTDKVDKLANKVDIVEGRLDSIDICLDKIDVRLDGVEDNLEKINDRLESVEGDVGQIKYYIFQNVEPRIHVLEVRETIV